MRLIVGKKKCPGSEIQHLWPKLLPVIPPTDILRMLGFAKNNVCVWTDLC